jgi:5-methyltetrahydrofolate--homocysteine methyltransferase
MRPFLEELAQKAGVFVSAYPNAGLPNALAPTGFDLLPHHMAEFAKDFGQSGFVNIMGGCCGNTPEHIAAIAQAVKGIAPRVVPTPEPIMRLSGSEAYNLTKSANYLMIGARMWRDRLNLRSWSRRINLKKPCRWLVSRWRMERM